MKKYEGLFANSSPSGRGRVRVLELLTTSNSLQKPSPNLSQRERDFITQAQPRLSAGVSVQLVIRRLAAFLNVPKPNGAA